MDSSHHGWNNSRVLGYDGAQNARRCLHRDLRRRNFYHGCLQLCLCSAGPERAPALRPDWSYSAGRRHLLVVGNALAVRLARLWMVSVLGLAEAAADGHLAGSGTGGRIDSATVRTKLA